MPLAYIHWIEGAHAMPPIYNPPGYPAHPIYNPPDASVMPPIYYPPTPPEGAHPMPPIFYPPYPAHPIVIPPPPATPPPGAQPMPPFYPGGPPSEGSDGAWAWSPIYGWVWVPAPTPPPDDTPVVNPLPTNTS